MNIEHRAVVRYKHPVPCPNRLSVVSGHLRQHWATTCRKMRAKRNDKRDNREKRMGVKATDVTPGCPVIIAVSPCNSMSGPIAPRGTRHGGARGRRCNSIAKRRPDPHAQLENLHKQERHRSFVSPQCLPRAVTTFHPLRAWDVLLQIRFGFQRTIHASSLGRSHTLFPTPISVIPTALSRLTGVGAVSGSNSLAIHALSNRVRGASNSSRFHLVPTPIVVEIYVRASCNSNSARWH